MPALRLSYYRVVGFHPDNPKEEFLVNDELVQALQANGPARKYYDADNIQDVLRTPLCIFEGLKRAEFEDALCYCGKPKTRWNGTVDEPSPNDKVFVAYLVFSEEKDSWVVFDWEWREEDDNKSGYPKDWDKDFVGELWPMN